MTAHLLVFLLQPGLAFGGTVYLEREAVGHPRGLVRPIHGISGGVVVDRRGRATVGSWGDSL